MPNSSSCALLPFSGPAAAALPRLYCFPYAGSTSSVFAPWGKALASQFSIVGVDLPGHGSCYKEGLLDDLLEMAVRAAAAIHLAEDQPGRSAGFSFYGHSLGAVVAYETARVLKQQCLKPLTHLFVGAARAPEIPSAMPEISRLGDAEFLEAVQKRYGGLPAILFEEPELLAMVLPVLRADFRAYEAYRFRDGERLTVPLTAFCGKQDAVIPCSAMNAWANTTTGYFQLHAMDGGHFFLNECKDVLLSTIRKALQSADPAFTSSLQREVTAG